MMLPLLLLKLFKIYLEFFRSFLFSKIYKKPDNAVKNVEA